MDIKIGQVNINARQIERLPDLKGNGILGFSLVDDTLVAVTDRELTDQEKEDLIVAAHALDAVTPSDAEIAAEEIKNTETKKDEEITLPELVALLRQKGIIGPKGRV